MENASKALIMAGEILIGVLIISLASYIFVQFGTYSKTLHTKMDEAEINQFNVNFTNFSGKANITMQDISSIINFAKQRNMDYDASSGDDYFIDVCIDGTSVLDMDINEFLENNKNNVFYYCNLKNLKIKKDDTSLELMATATDEDILYNQRTLLVTKINFHEVTGTNVEDYVNALLEGSKIVWSVD